MKDFRLKSHDEKTLFEHLEKVGRSCRDHMAIYQRFPSDIFRTSPLQDTAYVIGVTHDFAKATSFFQDMINKKSGKSKYSRHSGLSSLFSYFACTKILPDDENLCALAYLATLRHHGNLKDVWGEETDPDRFQVDVLKKQMGSILEEREGWSPICELRDIYKQLLPQVDIDTFVKTDLDHLVKQVRKSLKCIARESDINNYFTLLALYSALQESDKSDAAGIGYPPRGNELGLNKVIDHRSKKFGTDKSRMSRLRDEAFEEVIGNVRKLDLNERMLSITLPTGLGKTLAGFATALLIRQMAEEQSGYSPRIIYALPFLSIIDQNQKVLEDVMSLNGKEVPSNLLLVHHHLAEASYKLDTDEEESIDLKSSIFLTEGWHSEIIITTFVQLFHSLITNRKNTLRKFNNIAGSIIVLDEVQAIPTKYWEAIETCLTYLCKNFGCWVILMTATKPNIMQKCRELATRQKYASMERVRYTLRLSEQSLQDVVNYLFLLTKTKNSALCVLNTIGESKEVYHSLKEKLDNVLGSSVVENGIRKYDDLQLIYLSSSVLPKSRFDRIYAIKSADMKTIVVSTQVVEAGVDIDMDVVIRDFAPLDCIVQSAGRCNRNASNTVGDVVIFNLKDDNTRKEYCKYVYDRVLLDKTQEVMSSLPPNTVGESLMLAKIGNYFSKARNAIAQEPVVDDICRLNFNKVGEFQLIENYETIEIFLETDEEAKEARSLIETNRFKKNWNFKLKRIFNYNMINVRKPSEMQVAQLLPRIGDTEIRYIRMDELASWYDAETGLDLRIDSAVERLIV